MNIKHSICWVKLPVPHPEVESRELQGPIMLVEYATTIDICLAEPHHGCHIIRRLVSEQQASLTRSTDYIIDESLRRCVRVLSQQVLTCDGNSLALNHGNAWGSCGQREWLVVHRLDVYRHCDIA